MEVSGMAMMKEKYTTCEMNIIEFDVEDVIVTSPPDRNEIETVSP